MIFHRKRKHIPELKVLIDGCNIECVSSFNFLVENDGSRLILE